MYIAMGYDAAKIAAMPPTTIRLLKKSINRTQDLMSMRDALEQHFALHEFGHTTRESQQLLHEARERQSLKSYFAQRKSVQKIAQGRGCLGPVFLQRSQGPRYLLRINCRGRFFFNPQIT